MPQTPHSIPRSLLLALAAAALIPACNRGQVSELGQGPSQDELLRFYSPRSVKVLPFTKARSFDADAIPDGLGVSLKTLDAGGDAVKAYGLFIFELYAYRPASSDHRGDLIQSWNQPIGSIEDQVQFWSRITDTYEFQLSWEGMPIEPQKKYILAASFQAPGGDRLFDQYEFEFRVDREEILNALKQPDAQ